MKIPHRVPYREPQSQTVTPAYQNEVDRTLAKAETAWRAAQARLLKAERRLEKARAKHRTHTHLAELEAVVERRRLELEELHRLMVATGAPSTARGKKSHRHVSIGGVL